MGGGYQVDTAVLWALEDHLGLSVWFVGERKDFIIYSEFHSREANRGQTWSALLVLVNIQAAASGTNWVVLNKLNEFLGAARKKGIRIV